MARGGKRTGAGRKRGAANLLTRELRDNINADACIAFLQNVVLGKEPGATLSHRIDAATTLLRKTLPDCRQTELTIDSIRTIEDELSDLDIGD